MNVSLKSIPCFSFIQEKINSFNLTPLQKKIIAIVTVAFACLASCYYTAKYFRSRSRGDDAHLDNMHLNEIKNIARLGDKDELFSYLMKKGNSIKELNLEQFLPLFDSDLEKIVIFCPFLKKLSLKGASIIDLKHLERLRSLEDLDLSNCEFITKEGVHHFEKLTQLKHLNLYGCDIKEEDVSYLENSHPSLEYIILYGCVEMEDPWQPLPFIRGL